MSRYNNLQIPTAIRPDAKLGKLRTSMIGKHFAYDHDLDGFNVVEILPLELTPTASDFIGGNDLKTTLVIPAGLPAVKLPVADVFPNIDLAIIEEQSLVVANLDVAFAGLSCTFVVPNSLISSYQSEYPTLTFTSWVLDVVFTIPYVGNTELTIEYVDQVVRVASGNVNDVDKVVVPAEFTSYEMDVFNYIFMKFPNAQSIEYTGFGEYQFVEYVETPNREAWISTSLTLEIDDIIKTKTTTSVINSDENCFLGAGGGGFENYYQNGEFFVWHSDAYAQTLVSGPTTGIVANTPYEHVIKIDSISNAKPLNILSYNLGGGYYGRLYYLTIERNGSVIHNLIPVYRKSDNVIGLLDIVENQFYTKTHGSGSFTKGSDVANPTETILRHALSTCTIYYDSDTSHTLTPAIVQNTLTHVPEFATAEKVIVPKWFTEYESGSINAIISAFDDMEMLTTCYEAGNIDLDVNGDVVAKITQIERNLDTELSKARKWSVNAEAVDISDLSIMPPVNRSFNYDFNKNKNIVYIGEVTNTIDLFSWIFHETSNLVEMHGMTFTASFSGWGYAAFSGMSSLKRASIVFTGNSENSLTFQCGGATLLEQLTLSSIKSNVKCDYSTQFTRQALVDLINSLGTPATQRTLTIGATNLAKLTAEDIAIATAKGWLIQ